jgi:transposase
MKHKEARMHQAKILKDQGFTQLEIGAALGVSDRMVRKYLKDAPPTQPRPARTSLLDPFKPLIDSLLEERPMHNLVLLRDRLKEQGYSGGMTILREYAGKIRAKESAKAVIRFETEPGRQAQVDWKEAGTWLIEGVPRKVYAFVLLLGYSRRAFVRFTTDMKLPTLLACHLKSFEHFGGIPREILYDNMKTAWLCAGGEWEVNPRLLRFASDCGFNPLRCRVRRPETKGKVERFIGYLGHNYLEMARERGYERLEDLNGGVLEWLEKVDAQEIRDFCQTRTERFAVEQPCLKPYSARNAPDIRPLCDVVVSREGYIRYETNRYSVPADYVGNTLQLRPDPLSRMADILHASTHLRTIRLENPGMKSVQTLPEDRTSLFELWQRQNKPSPKRQKRDIQAKKDVEVDIRSPGSYDLLFTGGAS